MHRSTLTFNPTNRKNSRMVLDINILYRFKHRNSKTNNVHCALNSIKQEARFVTWCELVSIVFNLVCVLFFRLLLVDEFHRPIAARYVDKSTPIMEGRTGSKGSLICQM